MRSDLSVINTYQHPSTHPPASSVAVPLFRGGCSVVDALTVLQRGAFFERARLCGYVKSKTTLAQRTSHTDHASNLADIYQQYSDPAVFSFV